MSLVESIGIFQAKTHLSQLVDRASRGETIEITRHGKPVAQLTPVAPRKKLSNVEIEQIKESFRRIRESPTNKLTREFIVEAIREGREGRG